jgi:polygalacturonase
MSAGGYSTVINITSFGAVADGRTLCTGAFAAAVDACAAAGGGTIYVPAGKYLTGPIHFQSNITLDLDAGARLVFSQNIADFPVLFSRWEGVECEVYSPLIYGTNLENVAVTGRGVINGQGEVWWEKQRQNTLEYPRPRMIGFEKCRNVLIEGLTLINSPAWTINPIRCENVTVNKVTIKNPADVPTTDGIDPDSCRNVHIANCHVDVGDDCIALKSGTEACRTKIACENITITNCTMVHGHGGVVIGSEMSGDVRNVVISNCIFEGTDRGIRIKSRRGRGGVVEDIRVNNIIMKNVITPFAMNQYYHCGPGGKGKAIWDKNPHRVDQTTPTFRRIYFSNITAREVTASAGFLYGLPELPIADVSFDNVAVQLAEDATLGMPDMLCQFEPVKQHGFFCCNVRDIYFKNVTVSSPTGPAFQIENVANLEMVHCVGEKTNPGEPVIQLQNVVGAVVEASRMATGQETYLEIQGSQSQGIELTGRRIHADQIRLVADVAADAPLSSDL